MCDISVSEALFATLCRNVLTSLTVKLGAPKACFSAAVEQRSGKIRVAGNVRDGRPFLSEVGDYDVDVALEVSKKRPLCMLGHLGNQISETLCCMKLVSPVVVGAQRVPTVGWHFTIRSCLLPGRPLRDAVPAPMQGYVLLVRQQDRPGIIAAVSAILGREDVNISFMTVGIVATACSTQSIHVQLPLSVHMPAACLGPLSPADHALLYENGSCTFLTPHPLRYIHRCAGRWRARRP